MVLSYQIAITVNGDGSVSKFPNKTNYDIDEVCTLTASPIGAASFNGWSGDIGAADPNDLSINVTSGEERTLFITADFTTTSPPGPITPPSVATGVEDFRTYRRIDSAGNVSVTQTRVSWVNANRNISAAVYKTFNAGYITDFTQSMTIYLSAHETTDHWVAVGIWGISNGNFTLQTMINARDGISLFWSPDSHSLRLRDMLSNESDISTILELNTVYYLIIKRIKNRTTVQIYSDEDRTELVDEIGVTANSNTPYSTLLTYHSYNNVSYSGVSSGYVELLQPMNPTSTAWICLTGNMNLQTIHRP